jgi:hypothetical protein
LVKVGAADTIGRPMETLTRGWSVGYSGCMESSDITIEILKEIRDEIRGTNERMDKLSDRVERLERRQVETETRLATELIAVVRAVDDVKELLRDRLDLSDLVSDHERRIVVLERLVPASPP